MSQEIAGKRRELIEKFQELEYEIGKWTLKALKVRYKQCQIVLELYLNFGSEAIRELSQKTGYSIQYLYDMKKVAEMVPDEESLEKMIEEGIVKNFRELVRFRFSKREYLLHKKIIDQIELVERKVANIEELLETRFVDPTTEEMVQNFKREYEEFKIYLAKLLEENLYQILFQIYQKDEFSTKEKVMYFDMIKETLSKLPQLKKQT